MEADVSEQFHIERKRAAVEVFRLASHYKKEKYFESLSPLSLAQAASGGASKSQIYRWLKQDLSDEAVDARKSHPRHPPALTEDQVALLVGFAVSRRAAFEVVSLDILRNFCNNHFNTLPSLSTISRIMNEHDMTSQSSLKRNSRMVSEDVVEDAIDAIQQIRRLNYPPDRIICMDETGLWSNVTNPKTYHYRNWFEIFKLVENWRLTSFTEWSHFFPFVATAILASGLQLFALISIGAML